MDNKIAGLNQKQWAEIWRLPHNDPERKEKESLLVQFIKENPENIHALILGLEIGTDAYKRQDYLTKLIKETKEKKELAYYLFSIHFCKTWGRTELAEELDREMKEKYPVRGRAMDLFAKAHRDYD